MEQDSDIYIYNAAVSDWNTERLSACETVLSDGERARLGRFGGPSDRARFALGRALLRLLLSARLGVGPETHDFSFGPKGKPALSGGKGTEFNLSHSGDMVFIAIANSAPVGIDVEQSRETIAHADLARRFFSTYENASLANMPESERLAGFFRFWTRKEAYLKARGTGITVALSEVDISSPAARNGKIPVRAGKPVQEETLVWQVKDLDAPEGYFAAVSSPGRFWSAKQSRIVPAMLGASGRAISLG